MPQCLEVRSLDDYTPLGLAFQTHNLTAAKILIAAGADQTVRYRDGMNLIHLALSPKRARKEVTLSDMLSLIDPRLLPSMLTERCSSHQGSLTPLALWMTTHHHSDRNAEHILQTMLDLAEPTGQKHLELLDGSGNTVIHRAVNELECGALKEFLSRRPDLLHRENAVGTTPAELAENKWVAKMTSDPPIAPHPGRYCSYQKIDLGNCNVLYQWPSEFAKKDKPAGYSKNWTERDAHGICTEIGKQQRGAKRKLVSLFDANEVAKRLAVRKGSDGNRRYRRRRYRHSEDYEEEVDGESKGDEVMQWL